MTKNQFSVSENSVFFGYFLITDNARFSAVNRLCVSVPSGLFARREIPIYPDSTHCRQSACPSASVLYAKTARRTRAVRYLASVARQALDLFGERYYLCFQKIHDREIVVYILHQKRIGDLFVSALSVFRQRDELAVIAQRQNDLIPPRHPGYEIGVVE